MKILIEADPYFAGHILDREREMIEIVQRIDPFFLSIPYDDGSHAPFQD